MGRKGTLQGLSDVWRVLRTVTALQHTEHTAGQCSQQAVVPTTRQQPLCGKPACVRAYVGSCLAFGGWLRRAADKCSCLCWHAQAVVTHAACWCWQHAECRPAYGLVQQHCFHEVLLHESSTGSGSSTFCLSAVVCAKVLQVDR